MGEFNGRLPLTGFYFFSFAALGALFPYLPPLLSDRGLSASEIGWVMLMLPLTGLFLPTVWGAVADALRARILLLRLTSIGCGLAVLLLIPAHSMWAVMGAFLLLSALRVAIIPLADAITCAALGGEISIFGSIRVWGSVGFAVAVLGMGLWEGTHSAWLLVGVTSALYFASALATKGLKVPGVELQQGILREAGKLLRQGPIFVFLLGSAAYYAGHSTYDAYFGLHLRALGHGDAVLGMAWFNGVCWEIGVMLLAPKLLGGWRSGPLLMISSVAAALRWTLISVVTGKWTIIAVQSLHGLTFGLWYLSLVRFVQDRAPERLRATCQSMAFTSLGAGTVIGYLVGSRVLDHRGGEAMYRLSAGAAGVAFLLYWLVSRMARAEERG